MIYYTHDESFLAGGDIYLAILIIVGALRRGGRLVGDLWILDQSL